MGFKVEINIERCKGCMLCVDVCPKRVITVSKQLNSLGAHFALIAAPNNCIGCLQCAIICPDAAIEIEQHDEVEQDKIGRSGSHHGQ